MPEQSGGEHNKSPDETKWAEYNVRMADPFAERDRYPVGSPERDAAAQRILDLWVAEG